MDRRKQYQYFQPRVSHCDCGVKVLRAGSGSAWNFTFFSHSELADRDQVSPTVGKLMCRVKQNLGSSYGKLTNHFTLESKVKFKQSKAYIA